MNITLSIPKKKPKMTPAQALPFKEYNDYLKMNDGTYRCILKVSPINNDLLADDENESVVQNMQEAINAAPNSSIQQITISSERLNLDDYIAYLEQKHRETTQSYFLERLEAVQSYVKRTSIRQRTTKTFYFTLASRTSDLTRATEEFQDAVKRISDALSASDIYIKVLRKHDGLRMLYEKLNPRTSVSQPYQPSMNTLTSIAPVPITHEWESHSTMDGMFYRFFTITNYPSTPVKPAWLSAVLNVNAEVDVSIILQPRGKQKIIDSIDKSLGFIRYRRDQPGTRQSEKNELDRKEASSIELLNQLSSDAENMYNVTIMISVRERTLKELDLSSDRVLTAVSSSRMNARQVVLLGNDPIWMTLPIAYKSHHLSNPNMCWPMQSSAIASILPFNSSDFMMSTGVIKGKNPNTNSLIIADRRERRAVDNPNEVVIAPSGRGKTVYAQADISRENQLGTKIIVIDPEREYKFKFGERVVFSIGSPFCTNPFHIRSAIIDLDDEEEEDVHNDSRNYVEDVGQYLQRKIADLIPFFRQIYPAMDSTEEAELSRAMITVYDEKAGLNFHSKELPDTFPTISDLDEICSRQEFNLLGNFRKNLSPYVNGIYAKMFNGQTNWSMDTELTVLDINSLSEVIQPQMMYLLLQDIWEYIKIDRNEAKGLYVDEAWKLADPDNPQTLKFLYSLAKRIRKYGGYLTTITQNVEDFFGAGKGSKNYGQAIFDNAFFKMFLGLSEKDYSTLKETGFTFSRKEERILKRRKSKGRGIYMIGSTRVEIQSTPLVDELQFIDPSEYKRLRQFEHDLEYAEAMGMR